MKRLMIVLSVFILTFFSWVNKAEAHCEIPCGIYGDSIRVALLYEHITTVEKSMVEIEKLSKSDNVDYNQLVRWIVNKEEHAVKIQEIVSQYFLHQRIKVKDETDEAGYSKYTSQLVVLHKILIFSMKAKQSTELDHIMKLRNLVHEFEHSYFDHPHKH